jgi:UDP-N-acetylglucosamine 1-carboxyvinyltransferase
MDKFIIRGGNPLVGTVRVSGAKNSALPCMAAAILTEEEITLENIPQVRDIATERRLLASMGASVELRESVTPEDGPASANVDGVALKHTTISCRSLSDPVARYEIVKTMRASSLVLGPLIARAGVARVAMPGGCAIGGRPIDMHIKGLEKMGAVILQEHGNLEASASRLRGAHIVFDRITVTGTEDLLMAAVLADGETLLENCAREPEVVDLAALLTAMGARIEGAGTSNIRVHGVSSLHGARYRINPDRIEAGTFLIAGAITRGDLIVADCNVDHLGALIAKLRENGVRVEVLGPSAVRVRAAEHLCAADISTEEYPGFPTDMQAQYMALATQAEGVCQVRENIFENRFMHVQELVRMGANIKVDGNAATVRGPAKLSSAAVMCSDLRASASLVLAALVADGESVVDRVYHMDRGYEHFEEKLRSVGAQIQRLGDVFAPREAVAAAV